MKTVSMSGSLRENVGKKDAKALRKQGDVPCVLYGGEKQIHFAMEAKKFKNVIFTPEVCFIDLHIDGKEYKAILQDVQYHPVTDNIYHVDFLELIEGKPIAMNIPVKLEGVAPGILLGGKMHLMLRKVLIKGLPKDLPDSITLNIDKLGIGNSITIADVETEKLEFLHPRNAVIVLVKVTRIVEEEVEDEEEEGEEGETTEGAEGTEGAPAAATDKPAE